MSTKFVEKLWNALLVAGFFSLIILFIIYRNPDLTLNVQALSKYAPLFVGAYGRTIAISVSSLVLSIGMGIVLFFMIISNKLYLRYFYTCYTQIALGVPLMVHIIVLYFFFTAAIGIKSPIVGGTLIVSGYMAAYFAKTFEGAYYAIDEQQFKIMHILQLPASIRMGKIIFPQMITNTLPTLTSHFALLVKSTALLSLISVPEFTNFINIFNSTTFEFVTGYIMLAVGYLVITIPLSIFTIWLNKKVSQL